ncbi:MAG: hypothetical protein AABX68_01070 [Nanoarchaeota archaeon]
MDFVESIDSKKLENLAISFADVVLRKRKWYPLNAVNLHGSDPKTISVIKKVMESYFREKDVEIAVGSGFEGYHIDVGYFMRR